MEAQGQAKLNDTMLATLHYGAAYPYNAMRGSGQIRFPGVDFSAGEALQPTARGGRQELQPCSCTAWPPGFAPPPVRHTLGCCWGMPSRCLPAAGAPQRRAATTPFGPSPPNSPPLPRPCPAAMHNFALEWTSDPVTGRPATMTWLLDGRPWYQQNLDISWSTGTASPYTERELGCCVCECVFWGRGRPGAMARCRCPCVNGRPSVLSARRGYWLVLVHEPRPEKAPCSESPAPP